MTFVNVGIKIQKKNNKFERTEKNMQFKKDVIYLGMQKKQLQDGVLLYTVSLFLAEEQIPIEINVLGTATDLLSCLVMLKFGDKVKATFALRPKDKLYRLALLSV